MTREEKENLLREAREAVDILIDNHLMISKDNAEFSQWIEDLIDNYCEEQTDSLPPVQPIRPRGHWILVSDKTPGGYWKCSECLMHKRMNSILRLDSFCSCCGADMREGAKMSENPTGSSHSEGS